MYRLSYGILRSRADAEDAVSEAADDAFYNSLYRAYEADPDKGQPVSLEDAAKALGVSL